MKTMKRMVTALCVLSLMLVMIPSAFACGPGPDDLWGCNEDIQYPKCHRAYLRYCPSADSDYFDYVYEAAKVTVLARENGYSLITTNDGVAGWVTSKLLVKHYK